MVNGSKNDCFLGNNFISEIENRGESERREKREKEKEFLYYFQLRQQIDPPFTLLPLLLLLCVFSLTHSLSSHSFFIVA
jgi:hypothetical protein